MLCNIATVRLKKDMGKKRTTFSFRLSVLEEDCENAISDMIFHKYQNCLTS